MKNHLAETFRSLKDFDFCLWTMALWPPTS
jgi:hypothetical protein